MIMGRIPKIRIDDYDYELPEGRIAQFPVEKRDKSQLLIYNKGITSFDLFRNIHKYIPEKWLMVFNNARVIKARLNFLKETGAAVEVFCLEPLAPPDYERVFNSTGPVEWKCLIGNLRKWKNGILTSDYINENKPYRLSAEKINKEGEAWRVRFSWQPEGMTFGDMLESAGHIPLPPYVRREDKKEDYIRYQTVYSKNDGSVASPTAGLHFTTEVLEDIAGKGISSAELTLHVSAGTFQTVKAEYADRHKMHCEHFSVSRESVEAISGAGGRIIAVGTTSVRTLESLYWLGIRTLQNPDFIVHNPVIEQWEWTEVKEEISMQRSLGALLRIMEMRDMKTLQASTDIMIIPGYRFRMVNGMITNFHQPRSTLLLLISSWVGGDWKNIYEHALEKGFRFLSYGDTSLLL